MLLMLTLLACITESVISYEQLKEASNHCTDHGETITLLTVTGWVWSTQDVHVKCENGATYFCLGKEPGDLYGRYCKDRED